ncbi:hypothetical protein ACTHPH_18485 [Paenibacillus pasadenensis]
MNVAIYLVPESGDGKSNKNYDFDSKIFHPNNTLIQADDHGAGNDYVMYLSNLAPSETVYWRVRGHTTNGFSSTQSYLKWIGITRL